MNNKKFLYYCLLLDEESSKTLLKLGQKILAENVEIEFSPKWFCHHMTILFHTNQNEELIKWCENNIGNIYDMKVTSIGISDKALAVHVETEAPSNNTLKHITLAVNTKNNGKPFDSNRIENWFPLKENFIIKGIVTKII